MVLALHLTNAAPAPDEEQNMALNPPELPEIIPQSVDYTPPQDSYPPGEYTPPSETPPTGWNTNPEMDPANPDWRPDMEQPNPDTGNYPPPGEGGGGGVDGMAYTTTSPQYRSGTTRKTRWSSNRNTVKRYNNLNPVTQRGRKNSNRGQSSDRQQGVGDGIMPSFQYSDKWNRIGVIKGGD